MRRRPLDGVRVVDLTTQMPGPYCTRMLADLGADVIKVEAPRGDPLRAYAPMFDEVNRGKRSLVLDLKRADAREVLHRLVRRSDLFLEGFRPGVAARLGADYETLAALNPGLVYCSISGFGQDGPERGRPAHDVNYLALGGVLDLDARVCGAPHPPGVLVSDLAAGQYAAVACLAALVGRLAGGPGQYIDLSMTDGVAAWTAVEHARLAAEGRPAEKPNVTVAPCYGVFRTADGRFVTLGIVYEDDFWRAFCDVAGLADLRELVHAERVARFEEVRERLAGLFASDTRDGWTRRFEGSNVPFAPVLDLEEVRRWPQFAHRGLFAGPAVAMPMRFSAADVRPGGPAPSLGEHGRELLAECGYGEAEVEALVEAGAVSLGP
ncbi:MAG TPA: CaiB/BaiF CoA-transferase family protein [Thermodesulfobacteriota bacterium]